MMMNVLFVYSAAKFRIESPIEFLGMGKAVEVIAPGERVLGPGVYRFANGVGVAQVSAINGSAGDAQILPVPNEKSPWPDPPVINKVTSVLGVTRDDLIDFLGGSGVDTEV